MTNKSLLFAALLAAYTLGASAAEKSASPSGYGANNPDQSPVTAGKCKSRCVHEVTIVDVSANPCKLRIEPELMYIHGGKPAKIEWNLKDAPPDFKLKIVRFKDESPAYLKEYKKRIATPSGRQFHDKHVTNGGKSVDVTDDDSIDGAWYYNLEASDGKTVCTIDPPLINGN